MLYLDICQENYKTNKKKRKNTCNFLKNCVNLQCVFHSIRFKVNKDWGSAEPFFCVRSQNLSRTKSILQKPYLHLLDKTL